MTITSYILMVRHLRFLIIFSGAFSHFAQGDTTLLHRQGEQEWTLIMVSHSFCMWLLTAGIPSIYIFWTGMPAVSNHIQKLCDTIINVHSCSPCRCRSVVSPCAKCSPGQFALVQTAPPLPPPPPRHSALVQSVPP